MGSMICFVKDGSKFLFTFGHFAWSIFSSMPSFAICAIW